MSLEQLGKRLSKINGLSEEESTVLVKRRLNNIERYDYYTAFRRDKSRDNEFNEIEKNKVKLGGNGDE